MKEKPILFSAEMVQAILEGRKTQTRRVVKLPPMVQFENLDVAMILLSLEVKCPYGQTGNHLWVREKFTIECPYGPAKECDNPDHIIYWASEEPTVRDSVTEKWRPSIYMPRWASRITLYVKAIRIERVRDISLPDCIAEGMTWQDEQKARAPVTGKDFQQSWWRKRWNSINAKRGFRWENNPWVWVVDFRRT